MSSNKTFVSLLVAMLVAVSTLQAATYYVDHSAGSDANAGTSTGTAFQRCPGDTAATDTAASTTLAAGDTVLFKGGVTYTVDLSRKITLNKSGSIASPIVYRSGESSGWGTGMAFIDATGKTNADNVISFSSVSNVTVIGLAMTGIAITAPYAGLIGGTAATGGNLKIFDCVLTNTGGNGVYIQGLFNAGTNPSGIIVSNTTIKQTQWHGVFFRYGLDDIMVTNCTVFNTGISNYPGSFEGDNLTFYLGGTSHMSDVKVHGNNLSTSPVKGHILFYTPITDVSINGNYFHGTNRTASLLCGVSMTNVSYYNNVFDAKISQFEGIFRFQDGVGDMVIDGLDVFNNTLRCNLASGALFFFNKNIATLDTIYYNVTIKNNVVMSTSGAIPTILIAENAAATGPLMDLATFDCDYNTYSVASGSLFSYRGAGKTLSEWRTLTGGDANSVSNAPTFASGSLRLDSTDTVARGNGTNLTSFFTTDHDYNTRPSSGAWDIGAYEFIDPTTSQTFNAVTGRITGWRR